MIIDIVLKNVILIVVSKMQFKTVFLAHHCDLQNEITGILIYLFEDGIRTVQTYSQQSIL